MQKTTVIVLTLSLVFLYLLSVALADDEKAAQAVESVGEINAKDNSTGTVIAGMEARLILTLIADMSQAEPGEEIESILITLPSGFAARDGAVTAVRTGDEDIPNFGAVVDRNRITVVLPTLITLSTIVTIEFTVDPPATPAGGRAFMVSLLNILQSPIIISVKGGNADGRVNNDSFLVKTVAATKPEPPMDLSATAASDGENDIVLVWAKVDDSAVSGYLVYRLDEGDDPVADIADREQTSYVDRSLKPGETYSYTVRSYKTRTLRSDASSEASAVAPADTQPPLPPVVQPEITVTDKGNEISWTASPSQDIEMYIVYRGASLGSLEPIEEAAPDVTSHIDENPPESGSYLYAVVAIDDAGAESPPSATQLRQVLSGVEPQPNPFTPLSADPRYNQVTFPAIMLEGGEGAFAIRIFDLEGDLVFEEEVMDSKEIKWNGRDMEDEVVSSGIYVYQATMGSESRMGTIVVAK
jgi:hypothetical protein